MFNLFGKNYGKSLKQMMDELNEMMDESLNYELHSITEPSLDDKVKEEKGKTEDGEWIKTTYVSPNGTRYTVTTTYLGGLPNKPSKKGNDTLSSLKNELENCVENQDFEKAAQLRDQIKRMETNKSDIDKLEEELKTVIEKQDFEGAIILRDKIKELKKLRQLDPQFYDRLLAIFPDQEIHDRYSEDRDDEKIINTYCNEGLVGILKYIQDYILDKDLQAMALSRVYQLQQLMESDRNKAMNNYPVKYILKYFMRGQFGKLLLPNRTGHKEWKNLT
jgi:hypothetical protein